MRHPALLCPRAGAGLAALALLGAACASGPPPAGGPRLGPGGRAGTPVVAPGALRSILAAYSAANNAANVSLSTSDQDRDEQGSAAAIDDASFTLSQRAGFKTINGPEYYAFSFSAVSSAVPRQAGYPASVAALATQPFARGTPTSFVQANSCAGQGVLLELVRDSAGAPWRAAYEPAVQVTGFPQFAIGSDGFAPPAPPPSRLALGPSAIPGAMAVALQGYAVSGSLSDGLTSSDFVLGTQCWAVDDLHSEVERYAHSKLRYTVSVSPYLSQAPASFALSGGSALVLFAVNVLGQLSAATSGYGVLQRSTKGDPFSYDLPAGTYASINLPELCDLAVVDPAKGPTDGGPAVPQVVGAACGPLLGSGVPASAGPAISVSPTSNGPSAVLTSFDRRARS